MEASIQPVLLLTRPAVAAARFAAEVASVLPDLPVVIAPLMRPVPVAHDSARLRTAPGLVLTSPEAVPACGPGHGRLALCVGEGTGAAARAAGFQVQIGTTGEASGLLPLIAASPVPLIHAHGRHVARVLPVPGMVVYEQQPQPLDPAARRLLAGPAPVLWPLFSPRSASLAAAAAEGARASLWVIAISSAAAAAWGAAGGTGTPLVSDRPDAAGMLRAIRAAVRQAEQSPESRVEAARRPS
ncbi:uroporphyrinogen-III synthase [Paracoccus suum]|uniref:Uroporphyrinogen-III synthase n=1 Tax=Paracoccus suum TaxID=2259340 RepID=A0A344PIE9_9RHOB|nr:uroporphyrinogen-III synthase [Paracoccus suum]AXC49154.1 uroporphyrinogen-III synthase [Paracoccus suum]